MSAVTKIQWTDATVNPIRARRNPRTCSVHRYHVWRWETLANDPNEHPLDGMPCQCGGLLKEAKLFPREGVWNPNGEGEQPHVPGGNAKDEARAKQPVIAYACLYPKLAAVAREHGYALTLHGSLVADCDMVAVPWVADAVPGEELARALASRAGGALILDTHGDRPAGVRKHVIHLGGGPYIDLAVFPLRHVHGKPADDGVTEQLEEYLTPETIARMKAQSRG